MNRLAYFIIAAFVLIPAVVAGADTKIVTVSHTDGFAAMGQTQPARHDRQTIWLAADRMRVDQGTHSFIVIPGENRMLFLDHQAATWSAISLPVDLEALLPAGMGTQMLEMMRLEATVTPRDETRTVDGRTLHRYDLELISAIMKVSSTLWASPDVAFDLASYRRMYTPVLEMQPGMEDFAAELAKVDGYVFEQHGTLSMAMAGVTTSTSERTESIEQVDPPDGYYTPPGNYAEEPFDFMATVDSGTGR